MQGNHTLDCMNGVKQRGAFTILIIDSDADNRGSLTNHLESNGFIVFEAGNADEALFITGRINPNLIILDSNTSGESGVDMFQRLSSFSKSSGIPVMMVSKSQTRRLALH